MTVVTGCASREICEGAVVYTGMLEAVVNSDIVTGGEGDEAGKFVPIVRRARIDDFESLLT